MSYLDTASGTIVSRASGSERAGFIRRTFTHLAGAIVVFAVLEGYLQSLGWGAAAYSMLASQSSWMWLVVIVAFMGVSIVANKLAQDDYSKTVQYAGLGIYIAALSLIFLPVIYLATTFAPGVLKSAAIITGGLVTGLAAVAFITRKDFSFLGPIVGVGFFIAIALIVASLLFGFNLGTFFLGGMIILCAASVLYELSNVIHVYRTDQHVAASLSLFASVGILFYYVVNFLLSMAGGE